MTTKASDSMRKEGAADFSADFGRLAAEMLENARALPVPPVMVNPAAAMAAATAIGLGFSTQMAGAFFGALQGAFDATSKFAAVLDETPPDEAKPEVEIRPENVRPAPATNAATKVKLSVVPAKPDVKPEVAAKPASRPRKSDDLKQISGIGPKIEQVLNAKSIRSFAVIAGWSDEDAARIDAEFGFDGRIVRDGWVAQAKALLAKGRKRK
ncbi:MULTISPECIES: 5' DNA nuclease [unclassified Rhizobium]|jgi:NADH-quinone oxidoreductase subunit E|uniref:5' DNA nuclease n=1 Tax=unclassified Rhizobium TaxID=2613769 RepID=UPI0016128E9B|nr:MULTISPECIES: 5' DNA nuclease [unclassified Rhizobium]MBB3539403.1 NADH-quinone oxidoreductase subunit E [Rhizobium sp. BK399]MCS3741207.1 NADH-quinone oxidoreductase subunit E [Rhizobium sp. BK661]MCS4093371.1 NADH-quinone oxidoreductase subunit E [Rhizobium sp. BK176]